VNNVTIMSGDIGQKATLPTTATTSSTNPWGLALDGSAVLEWLHGHRPATRTTLTNTTAADVQQSSSPAVRQLHLLGQLGKQRRRNVQPVGPRQRVTNAPSRQLGHWGGGYAERLSYPSGDQLTFSGNSELAILARDVHHRLPPAGGDQLHLLGQLGRPRWRDVQLQLLSAAVTDCAFSATRLSTAPDVQQRLLPGTKLHLFGQLASVLAAGCMTTPLVGR